ncbi:hypothetical protein [Sinorhizobium medicae]|uniref:hypothetical protein n=1 Tax=Sinorhizobium medicae TaxID=110321 RepID=UPI002738ED97|nr:hypothetical protein [Sinorhizobium medicae]
MAPAHEEAARILEPEMRLVKLNSEVSQEIEPTLGIRVCDLAPDLQGPWACQGIRSNQRRSDHRLDARCFLQTGRRVLISRPAGLRHSVQLSRAAFTRLGRNG